MTASGDGNSWTNLLNERSMFLAPMDNPNLVSCYSNTVVSCLVAIGSVQGSLGKPGLSDNPHCRALIDLANLAPGQIGSTQKLREEVAAHSRELMFALDQQMDPHEFLVQLIDMMCWRPGETVQNVEATNVLEDLFLYEEQVTYKCENGKCGDKTPLSIPHFPVVSVEWQSGYQTLMELFRVRHTDLTDVACDTCPGKHNYSHATCQALLKPKVLSMHIKRYDNNLRKIRDPLDIPLIWQPFDDDTEYVLVAASIHIGNTIGQGHYQSIIVNPMEKTAFRLNDADKPELISGEQCIKEALKEGYIFHYEQADLFKRRNETRSPVKKMAFIGEKPSSSTAVRKLADTETNKQKKEQLIARLLKKEQVLDVATMSKSKLETLVKTLGLWSPEAKTYGDKRLRGLLALNLHQIFKEKAPLTYLGLCQHYGVDTRRLEADASSGLVPKVKAKSGLEKMSDSVKRMFTHHTEEKILFIDTVENIVTLLTRLEDGSLSMDNKKAIYLALKGFESKNLERLTPSLKKELTRSLILKLDVQQMREILDDFPEINQNTNNDRIAGQLRALALDNRAALARIVAMLSMADMLADLSANTKASTVKLLRKLEVKKMSPGEVAMLYEVLFNKASDTSTSAEKSLILIKKRLVQGLVTPIHTVNVLAILVQCPTVARPPGIEPSEHLTNLVLKNREAMHHLLDFIQQGSSSLPSTPAKMQTEDTQTDVGAARTVACNIDQIAETLEKQLSVSKPSAEAGESLDESSATDSQDESTHDEEFAFDESNVSLGQLLNDLEDQPQRVPLKTIHQHLTGRKEKNKSRLLPQVKEILVLKLISQVTIAQKRDILKNIPGVKVHKNNDKIDGQVKSEALKDRAVVSAILSLLNTPAPSSAAEVVQTNDEPLLVLMQRLDQEELEDWELGKIWMELFNSPITKRQLTKDRAKLKASMRKEVSQRLVALLNSEEIRDMLKFFKIKQQNLERIQHQMATVLLKRQDVFEHFKNFLTERVLESAAVSLETSPTCSQPVDQEEIALPEVEDPSVYSPAEAAEHLSQEDDNANTWVLETYSNADLQHIYHNYGGRQNAPRRQAMLQFIKNKALDTMLNGIPDFLLYDIPKDHDFEVERTSRTKSAVKERAKKDPKFMKSLMDLYEANPSDNFNRTNTSAAHASLDTLKGIRLKRNEYLKDGDFYLLPNSTRRNPILEAAKKVEAKMANLQFESCNRCRESRLNSGVNAETGLCPRCAQESAIPNVPFTWSEQNNMMPGPVPLELRHLTRIEMAAIAANRVVMTIIRLKGGGTKHKGHAITFGQDVASFARELPRLPSDLGIIYLKSPHRGLELRARKDRILRAINWLMAHNPNYRDQCTFSQDNLNHYPDDGVVEGVATMDMPMNFDPEPANRESANDSADHHGNAEEGYGEFFESSVNQAGPVQPTNDRIFDGLMNARSEHPDTEERPASPDGQQQEESPEGGERTVLDFPERSENPTSEFSPGFFTQTYPWLFPTGAGDITCPRAGKQPKLVEWVNHLMWLTEEDGSSNRFAKDATFVFHVVNMRQRQQAMMLGTVFADRVLADKNVAEVKDLMQDSESPILRSLMHFTSTIAGSNAHMASMRKNVIAAARNVQIMSDNQERYNVFITFSFPDLHLQDLHRLLPGHEDYLDKTVVPVWEEGLDPNLFIDKKSDYNLRAKAISENGHIVNEYIHIRLKLLIDSILTQHVGVVDFVVRSEFQSRSAIHFHAIARCRGVSLDDLEMAFKKHLVVEEFRAEVAEQYGEPSQPVDEEFEREKEKYVNECVQQQIDDFIKNGWWIVEDEDEIQEMKERKDRVVDFAVNLMGISGMNPVADAREWAPPEGLNPHPPVNNALRSSIRKVERDPDITLDDDYCALVQRVMLHTCKKNYCYPANAEVPHCRFKYPFSLQGYEAGHWEEVQDGDERRTFYPIHRKTGTMPKGAKIEDTHLNYLRNHGRIVEAIPELLSFWRGNIDVKIIKNVGTLINYIVKYITKPESRSESFAQIVKVILDNTNAEETTVRKTCQKVCMSLLKEHDITRPEAFKILSGYPFVLFSREFVAINMTDNRRVNVERFMNEDNNAPALSTNYADKYWTRLQDDNYLKACQKYAEDPSSCRHGDPAQISLYHFAALFHKNWTYRGTVKIPVPTPQYYYVPPQDKEEQYNSYCESTLLLFKPGTNPGNFLLHNPEEQDSEEYFLAHEALYTFVHDENSACPALIRKEFKDALSDKEEQAQQNIDELGQSPYADEEAEVDDPELEGLVRPQEDIDPDNQMEEVLALGDDDDVSVPGLEHDRGHDWQADRIALGLTNDDIKEAEKWIKLQKTTAQPDQEEEEGVTIDLASLNLNQRWVFDAAMKALDNPNEQKCIDVCGGAGKWACP